MIVAKTLSALAAELLASSRSSGVSVGFEVNVKRLSATPRPLNHLPPFITCQGDEQALVSLLDCFSSWSETITLALHSENEYQEFWVNPAS